jgi:two-component system, NarL family, invasion response regulator UvrY
MNRVLIADDHGIFRAALREILVNRAGMEVVGEAGDAREAIDLAKKLEPDILLLDVSMPGRPGLEAIEEVKRQAPKVRILMLTAHPEDQYALRCLKAGADGYMIKGAAFDELIEAVRRICAGGKYVSPHLAESLALNLAQGSEVPSHQDLSDREFEVMRMLAGGKTVSEIAEQLFLSPKTVSTYRARVLEKLGLKNTAEIVQYAVREGLVE